MGLHETIEELKKEESEAYASEAKEMEKEQEEEPESDVIEEVEKKEEEPKPEVEAPEKTAEPDPVPEKLDNSAYARMRRDKAAAEKRAKEAEERISKLEEQLKQKPDIEYEEPKAVLSPELQEIVQDHMQTKAELEFMTLENTFRQSKPDYDGVADAYSKAIAQSIRIQNPRLSPNDIAAKTKQTILYKASEYVNRGYDPIEELYEEAKSLGFTALAKLEVVETGEEAPKKPNLDKIAANKSRNAGMTGAKGRGGGGQVTRIAASDMTVEEWSRLPKEDKQRLLYGG